MKEKNDIIVSDAADFDEDEAITLPESMAKVTLISTDEDDLFCRLVSYSPILGQISGQFKLRPAPADRLRLC